MAERRSPKDPNTVAQPVEWRFMGCALFAPTRKNTAAQTGKVSCGGTCPPGFESSTGVRIFLNLFQDLTGAILSVVGDVSIDSEAPVVTSSISRICRLSLSKVLIGRGGPSGWAWDALAYLNFGPLSKKNYNFLF